MALGKWGNFSRSRLGVGAEPQTITDYASTTSLLSKLPFMID